MIFKELSETEFMSFAVNYPDNNFWQTANMAHMREKRGYTTAYTGVEKDGTIVAAAMLSFVPVAFSYTFCRIIRGPLMDFTDLELFDFFHENLVFWLKKKKCLYIHMDPYFAYKERDILGNIVEGGFDKLPPDTYGYKVGSELIHKTYGKGKILELDGDRAKIRFDDNIERSFSLKVLVDNNLISSI